MANGLDLFGQINNAVLDLQASDLQSYERPLKSLARLLDHPDLQGINNELIQGVDFNSFIADSKRSEGSMVGSAKLAWPDDPRHVLGLTLLLIKRLGENPELIIDFSFTFFYSGQKIMSGIHNLTRQMIIPFVRDYKAYVMNKGDTQPRLIKPLTKRIFVVHGHDGEARETVARYLENIGFEPIILHEQANRGRTVIEKVEANSDVSFAIVLLTPDDQGCANGGTPEPRARQNVLLELGYFIGKLGRDKVCALKRGELEIPSDFAGVVWETMDGGTGWKQALGRELQAAGHEIDWKKVMR